MRLREKQKKIRENKGITPQRLRLGGSLTLAVIVTVILIVVSGWGKEGGGNRSLSHAMAAGKGGRGEVNAQALASRAIEQKFQIQTEETTGFTGEIPYVDVWVLNDPFMPLVGEIGTLTDGTGTLDSKLFKMLGLTPGSTPLGSPAEGGTVSTPSAGGSVPRTASADSGKAVLVEDIYENRGIKYSRIKIGDVTYDRVKAGITFANNYKVVEFKGFDALVLMCGDEKYELKKGQLRRI